MRHIAIVGSGPAGYYTAEAAVKKWGDDARIDIFDKLPVPFGLIRTGVAPDHQSIKAVARRYEKTAIGQSVRFIGNVDVGGSVSIEELGSLYDAVILATGAPQDRPLDVPGARSGNGRVVRMAKSWGGRVGGRRWFQQGAGSRHPGYRVPGPGNWLHESGGP